LLLGLCFGIAAAAGARDVEIIDIFGRDVSSHGLTLVDWEGYLANPAIKFYVQPPTNIAFPANAILSANGDRLYFDSPSTVDASGPTKSIRFAGPASRVPVRLSIFPDRDGLDEDYVLTIRVAGQAGRQFPIHVLDQDRPATNQLNITIDFSQDLTGFFSDPAKRAIVQEAAQDWADFYDNMGLRVVPANSESTFIWDTNGFVSGHYVNNAGAYQGFLLYGYGIHSSALRSGGEGSYAGDFQTSGNLTLPLRRSGSFEAETEGNYNTLGWFLTVSPDDWWVTGNLGNQTNDFYSIAHHEIGHALGFNDAYPLFVQARTNNGIQDPAVIAYHGSAVAIDASDHFNGSIDDASRRGAFGYEYYGDMPACRWLPTKLDLLCAQAFGYRLRETSAFVPLAILTTNLPAATPNVPYQVGLLAQGGIPFYNWEISSGGLPPGLALDSFSGVISGTSAASGVYNVSVRLRDYIESGSGITNTFQLSVQSPIFQFDRTLLGRVATGAFSARLLGPTGLAEVIQVSSNLVTWSSVLTNSTGASHFDFTDPATNHSSSRFYRAVLIH
jgi:hypothetical protein